MLDELFRISRLIPLLPILSLVEYTILGIGLYKYPLLSKELRLTILFLLFSSTLDFSQWITALLDFENNLYLVNLKEAIEFICISFLYYHFFRKNKNKRVITLSLAILCLIIFILQFNWSEIAGYAITISRLILLTYVILLFHSILSDLSIEDILRHPPFWINSAFTFYACGTFFSFLFWETTRSIDVEIDIYITHEIIELSAFLVTILLLLVALLISKPRQKIV